MTFNQLIKNGCYSLISSFFVILPLSADLITDPNATASNQAQVTTSANGVPMVNIVAPNSNGLSHNQFLQYDVGNDHLLLNNAQNVVNTTISGTVQANPNLNGQSASIILNEVTGNNRSMLQGFTEIAGDSAELIIANSNGITCQGCGFINTPRAVLSTGTPNIVDQQLMSLSVNSGNILLSGDEVNTGNVDQFDLITRNVIIDTAAYAKGLNIVTGSNEVNYNTLEATPIAADSNEAVPEYAIDSSALGGMYAHTIKLVATEQGIGVKLDADMATNTGDITLSADGTIQINSASSAQDLDLKSQNGDITSNALLYAADKLSLTASGEVTNNGLVAAATSVNINTNRLTNNQDIIAGLKPDQSYNAIGRIDITVDDLINPGQIIATDQVRLNADTINNQNGLIESLINDVHLNYSISLNNTQGTIRSGNNIEITTGLYQAQADHGLEAGNNLIINAVDFSNAITFSVASNFVLNLTNQFNNLGILQITGLLDINTQQFTNQTNAQINSDGALTLNASGNVQNNGVISSSSNVIINATNINNQDVIASGDQITLNATQSITNGINDATSSALLFSVGAMNLYSDALINQYADIYSLSDINIALNAQGDANTSVLNSSASLESAANIFITTALLRNKRQAINTVDNSTVCNGVNTGHLVDPCSEVVSGASSVGIVDGTPISAGWLFDEALALWTGSFTDTAAQTQAIYAIIDQIFLAAVRTPSITAGTDLTITAGTVQNQAGILSAGNNINITANDFFQDSIFAIMPYGDIASNTDYNNLSPVEMATADNSIPTFSLAVVNDYIYPYTFFSSGPFPPINQTPQELLFLSNLADLQSNYTIIRNNHPMFYQLNSDMVQEVDTFLADYTLFPANLIAGNSININATNTINLGVNQVTPVTGSTPPVVTIPNVSTVVSSNPAPTNTDDINVSADIVPVSTTFDDIDNAIPDASDFVGVDVDTNVPTDGGLFNETDNDNFLVATNESVSQFIDTQGTDYLLEQLNYQPETLTKRLGDGFYENYLIREAIRKQTGQRFLHESITSDKQQFEYLMNNAVSAAERLDLSVGVSLTANQVASLTHDLVWLEERQVNGEPVLVPVLYLAQVRPDDINATGLIQAKNINLNSKTFNNSFNIVAQKNLNITTKQNLNNRGDLIAGNTLSLSSEGNTNNLATLASGRSVFIKTGGRFSSTGQNNQIISGGDINIAAQGNVSLQDSTLTAGSSNAFNALLKTKNTQKKQQIARQQQQARDAKANSTLNTILPNRTADQGLNGAPQMLSAQIVPSNPTSVGLPVKLNASNVRAIPISEDKIKAINGSPLNSVMEKMSAPKNIKQALGYQIAPKNYDQINASLRDNTVGIGFVSGPQGIKDTLITTPPRNTIKHAGNIPNQTITPIITDNKRSTGFISGSRASIKPAQPKTSQGSINISSGNDVLIDNSQLNAGFSAANASNNTVNRQTVSSPKEQDNITSSGNININASNNLTLNNSQLNAGLSYQLRPLKINRIKPLPSLKPSNKYSIGLVKSPVFTPKKGGNINLNAGAVANLSNTQLNAGVQAPNVATPPVNNTTASVNTLRRSVQKAANTTTNKPNTPRKTFSNVNGGAIAITSGEGINLSDSQLNAKQDLYLETQGQFNSTNSQLTANNSANNASKTLNKTNPSRLTIIADKGITNSNSTLNADSLIQIADKGSITNDETTKINASNDIIFKADGDITTWDNLNVANNIVLDAGRDLNNHGKDLTAGNDITLNAKRDVNITALAEKTVDTQSNMREVRTSTGKQQAGTQTTNTNTSQRSSNITAGGNLALNSGRNILLEGSHLKAQGDVSLIATNDITLRSAQNSTDSTIVNNERVYLEDDEGRGYSDISSSTQNNRTNSLVGSSITSGGNIIMDAGNNLVSQGTTLSAADALALRAAKNLSIKAAALSNVEKNNVKNGSSITNRVDYSASKLNATDITLVSGQDTTVTGSQVNARGNLNVDAQGNFILQRAQNTTDTTTTITTQEELGNGDDAYYGNVTRVTNSNGSTDLNSQFNAGQNLNINTGKDTLITGQDISANNDVNITAQGNILLDTTSKTTTTGEKGSKQYTERTTHTTSNINAQTGSINLSAQNDLTLKGSKLNANSGNIALNANNELNVLNVQDDDYSYKRKTSGNSLTGKKVKITEKLTTTNIESSLNANNITLNSRINTDGSISQTGTGTVNVISSDLNAKNNVVIAGEDINILAQKETNYNKTKTKRSRLLGLSKSSKTTTRKEELLRASNLNALEDDVDLLAQNNINIVGSNISAGKNINLDAKNNIDIQAGYNDTFNEVRKEKSSALSGGDLYRKSSDLKAQINHTAVNSQLDAQNINLNAGQGINLVGTYLTAADTINANAQAITIADAQSTKTNINNHTELSISLGDAVSSLTRPQDLISSEGGKLSINLATIKYDDSAEQITQTTSQGSNLNATNINLNAQSTQQGEGNVNIKASSLNADAINLDASHDVNIQNSINTTTTNQETTQGTAELKLVIKNEYEQAIRAAEDVKDAKDVLQDSKQALSDYKDELAEQQSNLIDLQQQVDNGSGLITQDDVDELQGHINQLKDDEDYYKGNIALATSGLASQTTAAAAQMAKAAQSSASYGFNIGLELDINAITEQLNSTEQASVASALNANNININAGDTTHIIGSNVNANDTLNINSQNLDIQAAQTQNRSNTQTEEENINLSIDVYSAINPDPNLDGPISMSASKDESQQNSQSTSYTNSQLNANNININVQDNTQITGGNVNANNQLKLNTQNLTLESQQNSQQTNGSSQGINVAGGASGLSSGGINNGKNQSQSNQTVLSSITSNSVNINVQEHTQITGAVIAAQDENGNDNGNLDLSSNTLTTANLSNTEQSSSLNQSISAASTVSLDHQNNNQNSLTKTQSTIGEGNITIGDTKNSDITTLNRDTDNVEVDIYDVTSNQGLSGSIDTNLLTETGRSKIAEDILKSGMVMNSIKLIITTDRVGLEDFFKETEKSHKTYEAIKDEIRKDPELAQALQNLNLTATEKENMLDGITNAVLSDLGYATHNNNLIATNETGQNGEQVAGFFSTEDGDAYINDQNINNTEGLVTTAGHEASHAMDMQDGNDVNNDENRADNNTYADNFGENLASYTEGALDVNGYDGGLADTNNHTSNDTSETILENNQDFSGLDKEQGDNRLTPHQETQLELELEQCESSICESAVNVKYGVISTWQGAAEISGITVSVVDKITDDIGSIVYLIDTMITDPQKAEEMSANFVASLERLDRAMSGEEPLSNEEMSQISQSINTTYNEIETAINDAKELDGEGWDASFKEGGKYGAVLIGATNIGKLDKFVDGLGSPKIINLSKVDPPKGISFNSTVYRYDSPNRLDTTWTQHDGNIKGDHRYTEEGQGGVYAGTTPETAFSEVTYSDTLGDRILDERQVELSNVLDLTDPNVRNQLGINHNDITLTKSNDSVSKYAVPQKIGIWAKEKGYDGLLVPSARNQGGSNIVILKND